MDLTIVDVFAERRYAGNQLAVVHDAQDLSTEQMQDIAREMNYSETTFVLEHNDERARVRLFTPEWELPFAGHPTLGTAWVLAGATGSYTLDLPIGAVRVDFEGDLGWMTPPPVTLGPEFDREDAADLIGLTASQLDPEFPVQLAEVGPKFILIGVRDLTALRAARFNDLLHQRYLADGVGVQCVFLFTTDSYEPNVDYAARMFFNSGGPREDPATGSANSAFAAYLKALKGSGFDAIVDQGVEINRPSRLYLRVGDAIQVGGKVQLAVLGKLV
ncbi:MAG: PhzF family phenazine biosynthesis protein [Pseudomonadales bacterium]|jgi:trans-2,3-dihydro-3-hydroxyanthranilate isomerase